MNLSQLKIGQKAVILRVHGSGQFRKRILEMGFIQGKEILAIQSAPLADPIQYRILGYDVSLRREDAERIEIKPLMGTIEVADTPSIAHTEWLLPERGDLHARQRQKQYSKELSIALVGNPNSGKTSLFNYLSGAQEKVGNYSGVTVEAKEAYIRYDEYRIRLIDLPGIYSLSPYSTEEVYAREFLTKDGNVDLVLNILDTTNLERNLYLSVQLKELGCQVVCALNMFDEFLERKEDLDYPKLSALLGTPMIPTVGRTGHGLQALMDELISVWEGLQAEPEALTDAQLGKLRPLSISYGEAITSAVHKLQKAEPKLSQAEALALLEQDTAIEEQVLTLGARGKGLLSLRNQQLPHIQESIEREDVQEYITDIRYGFIAGALRETYARRYEYSDRLTDRIDRLVTHRWWGFPIFLLLMFLMFETTFELGNYPMEWIEAGMRALKVYTANLMADGPVKDLVVEGIIEGISGVIVFLPNILLLYLFISIFEDTGYMARAAFIMDRLMHKMGLHGKSFIPLVMGFGCNVPAVMATRSIESKRSRMITMLVLPFMSCSARLPVYLLLAGALFPTNAGLVLFGLYLFGIAIAIISARLLKATAFDGEDLPFVMELPPYRIPTARSTIKHMWGKGKQYLNKMGTVILVASIIIWYLGYFPINESLEQETAQRIEAVELSNLTKEAKQEAISDINAHRNQEHQKQSYIGRMGQAFEPVIAPLGFDWKMGISLLSGMAAKEVVVSTLGVIYMGDGDDSEEAQQALGERILLEKRADGSPSFTPLIGIGFMIFVLLYFPCIATIIAIGRESGSWAWALFSVVYSCALAWVMSFLIYQIGSLIL